MLQQCLWLRELSAPAPVLGVELLPANRKCRSSPHVLAENHWTSPNQPSNSSAKGWLYIYIYIHTNMTLTPWVNKCPIKCISMLHKALLAPWLVAAVHQHVLRLLRKESAPDSGASAIPAHELACRVAARLILFQKSHQWLINTEITNQDCCNH